jgi:hypothetical protein
LVGFIFVFGWFYLLLVGSIFHWLGTAARRRQRRKRALRSDTEW